MMDQERYNDDDRLNAWADLCQAVFNLLELENTHLGNCGTRQCGLCYAIRVTDEALEQVDRVGA